MIKTLLFFMLASLQLFGKYDAAPVQACAAYNNMKHSKNTHNVHLDPSRVYTVMKDHKGQKLVLIKGEQPAQRWVDGSCFGIGSVMEVTPVASLSSSKAANKQRSRQNLLALSWHNAFCETHRYKKECKRGIRQFLLKKKSDDRFVLHGLWPQPRNRVYCNVPTRLILLDKRKQWRKLPPLGLGKEIREKLQEIMPGYHSYLHRHEWIKHGSCYNSDAEHYFLDAISLTQQINSSKIRTFFAKNQGKMVNLAQIRLFFDKVFGKGTGRKVDMQCKNGMITELWLHIGGGSDDLSDLLQKGKSTRSHCQRGRIDKAGFGR